MVDALWHTQSKVRTEVELQHSSASLRWPWEPSTSGGSVWLHQPAGMTIPRPRVALAEDRGWNYSARLSLLLRLPLLLRCQRSHQRNKRRVTHPHRFCPFLPLNPLDSDHFVENPVEHFASTTDNNISIILGAFYTKLLIRWAILLNNNWFFSFDLQLISKGEKLAPLECFQ